MPVKFHKKRFSLLVAVIVLGVILALAVTAFVWQQDSKKQESAKESTKVAEKKRPSFDSKACEGKSDKDLCRALANWSNSDRYRVTVDQPDVGKYIYGVDGNKSYTKSTINNASYEVILDGTSTTYTLAGGVWYKQAIDTSKIPVSEKGNENTSPEGGIINTANASKFSFVSKEACGELTCFKYQSKGEKILETVWFDDKDYKIRKSLTESDGKNMAVIFEYDAAIELPTTTKELAKDEFLAPGATAPTKIPSTATQQPSQR